MTLERIGKVGSIGGICLALFLILFGLTALVSLSIPGWVCALLACVAGLLILIGV